MVLYCRCGHPIWVERDPKHPRHLFVVYQRGQEKVVKRCPRCGRHIKKSQLHASTKEDLTCR